VKKERIFESFHQTRKYEKKKKKRGECHIPVLMVGTEIPAALTLFNKDLEDGKIRF
jgi:hypothetical protein